MFAENELTEARIETMIVALEEEKVGVATALKQAKTSVVKDDVEGEKRIKRLDNRAKAIDEELKKWKSRSSSSSKRGSKPAPAADDAVAGEGADVGEPDA